MASENSEGSWKFEVSGFKPAIERGSDVLVAVPILSQGDEDIAAPNGTSNLKLET
jgi:hypothetical protein